MININKLEILDTIKSIDVDITLSDIDDKFIEATINNIDITNLLDLTSNNLIFSIPSTVLELDRFDGVFTIKFITVKGKEKLALVADLTYYKECLLQGVLSLADIDCTCEEEIDNKVLDALLRQFILIETMSDEISMLNYNTECNNYLKNIDAIALIDKELKRYCICKTKDLDIEFAPRTNFNIIDNETILNKKTVCNEGCC